MTRVQPICQLILLLNEEKVSQGHEGLNPL